MANVRDRIRMTPEEVDAFLHERHTMSVATLQPDGRPHVVAMWYGFLGGAPAFETYRKSQKVVNLGRDPRMTCLVEDGDSYEELRGVELIARGTIIDESEALRTIARDLSQEGFTALARDLYHGEIAKHTEMDKASELMNSLPPDRAARDMGGAVSFLLGHEEVRGHSVGAVGYCMGGMLTMLLAAQQGDRIGAAVAYYGAPLGENEPDWSN